MPSGIRLKRINDRIKQILSLTLLAKTEDPRLQGVFITDVKVDRELDYANVYFSVIEGSTRVAEALEALNHARGFLKSELANEIDLRIMPKLRFYYDATPEKVDRIDSLLNQLRDEREQSGQDAEFHSPDGGDEDFDA